MNSVIIFVTLALVMAEDIPRNNDITEADCGFNIFCFLNDILLDTMNKLFIMLSLDGNFTEVRKVKLLINMHDNLRIIAENNYKIYEEITNTSKVNYDNKTVKPLFNLSQAIEEYFHEQQWEFIIYKNKTEIYHEHHESQDLTRFETNETAVNSIEFLSDFLEKVDKLSFQDLVESTKKLINESSDIGSGHVKYKIKTFNLKPWRPDNSSEDINTRRIFKGKRTKIKRYPFAASFHITGEFLCAGSIISRNLILSAASCLQIPYNYKSFQDNPNYLTVRIGSDFTNKLGDLVPVIGIILHPAYDPVHLQNNLAIARIKRPIIFQRRNKKIRRIEFNRKANVFLEDGGMVTVLGWGDKNKYDTKSYGDPISYAHLKIYSLQDCKDIYSPRYVTEMHFCAGFKQTGSGACNRDVGGPGIVGSTLVGVVSFGPPTCGTPDTPTVFTKLSYYSAWINDVITNNQVEEAYSTTMAPVLREREMLKVIVKELPMISTTPSTTTIKNVPKKLNVLKKLFKELIRTGTINVNDLFLNNDGNAKSTTALGSTEDSKVSFNRYVDFNKKIRGGEGMMMQKHSGFYKSTKGLKEEMIHEKRLPVEPIFIQPAEKTIRAVDFDNYETQIIDLESDMDFDDGLSLEFMPRMTVNLHSTNEQPLQSEVIMNDRDLRNINKKHKNTKFRNHNIVRERMVEEADAATEIVPFEVDENFNPIVTTKPPRAVEVKPIKDSKSDEETTTIKTYDTEESGAANFEFEIIAGGPEETSAKKSLLEYVNF